MFFELSKITWAILEPLNFLTLLLVIACGLMWLRYTRAVKYVLTAIVVPLFVVSIFPIGDLLLLPLERRFSPIQHLPERVDGIILLGGAQVPIISKYYGQPAMNDAAETMTTFLALAKAYPDARLVFSGGSGDILEQGVTESDTVKTFLLEQGFDASKVSYETRSRNTYENVIFSKEQAKPEEGQVWLLITSALRMPRAVGVFRKAGWKVTAVPCDFNAMPEPRAFQRLSVAGSLSTLTKGLREWIGLAAYWATAKTERLFPGPD